VDPRIERAIALIEQALPRRLSARSVSREVGISLSRFEHLFKRQTSQTFRAYVRTARLRTAAWLLQETKLGLKEVAAASGYSSHSAFTRAFRRRYHASPSRWRRGGGGDTFGTINGTLGTFKMLEMHLEQTYRRTMSLVL